MKKIPLYSSLLVLLVCMGCPPKASVFPIKEITYEAMTRGRSEMVHIKSDILTYKTHTDSKEISLSGKQLNALYEVLKPIKYKEASTLKAPSDRRFYDGALAATITFVTEEGSFQSAAFDDDNPPKELKELVDLLKKLSS
jgi:hypothetical protein